MRFGKVTEKYGDLRHRSRPQYSSISNMSYDKIKDRNMTRGKNPLRFKRMICGTQFSFALGETDLG